MDAFFQVGFIANIGDAFHAFFLNQIGNFFDELGLVDHIRQFRHDDLGLAAFAFNDFHLGTDLDAAAARGIGFADAGLAENDATGREIRTFDFCHEFRKLNIGIIDIRGDSVDDLTQIVRRNIGGHPDGNPLRTVDQ